MNGFWNRLEQVRPELETEFKTDCTVQNSGLLPAQLKARCAEIAAQPGLSHAIIKAQLEAFLLKNAPIAVCRAGWFADSLQHENIILNLRERWLQQIGNGPLTKTLQAHRAAQTTRAYTGEVDFGHTCPDWQAILTLGVPGLLRRAEQQQAALQKNGPLTAAQQEFYTAQKTVYTALGCYFGRVANAMEQAAGGEKRLLFSAKNMRALQTAAPQNILQAMQLISAFYFLQSFLEGTICRSIGRLDVLLYPYYQNDLSEGRFTKAQIAELLGFWFLRFKAYGVIANLPFTLCGLNGRGKDVTNSLSKLIIEVYGNLRVESPKLHIRCNAQTPKELLLKVLELIRSGCSSFLLCWDDTVKSALVKLGQAPQLAENYIMVGCYEPAAIGAEVPCTCAGRVNLLKAAELALTGGYDLLTGEQTGCHTGNVADFKTFKEYFNAVLAQTVFLAKKTMQLITAYEQYYPELHPSPLFSGTLQSCVQRGCDAYSGGAVYNNTSVCGLGLASAADAVIAVKKLVFEEKRLTLPQLLVLLKNNWQGQEQLRLYARGRLPKYGNNNPEVDTLAAELTACLAGALNGQPNGRGGVFRCGMFSIDWGADFGRPCAASANGRLCGEPLSKNIAATLSADKAGVTGLILSATRLNHTDLPNGTVLDLVLHPSAVSGAEGLQALLGLVQTYFNRGGMAVHLNVLDPAVLRRAQAEPQNYANLQIRLCGWNVYFNELSKQEQDAFILQAENNE